MNIQEHNESVQHFENQRAIDKIVKALNDSDMCNQDIVLVVTMAVEEAGYKLNY